MNRIMTVIVLVTLVLGGGVLSRFGFGADAVGFIVDVLAPVQSAITGSDSGFGRFASALGEVQALYDEKEFFRERAQTVDAKDAELRQLRDENVELRGLLQLSQTRPRDGPLAARVINWDPVSQLRVVTLDRGRSHGIAPGNVVITPQGLVGRVQRVTNSTAQVILAIAPSFSASATLQLARAHGIVDGPRGEAPNSPTDYMVMRYVDQRADVRPIDYVVTTELGGGFPDGILIGEAVSVAKKDTGKYQEIIIRPAVDFSRLDRVIVLTNWLPPGFD